MFCVGDSFCECVFYCYLSLNNYKNQRDRFSVKSNYVFYNVYFYCFNFHEYVFHLIFNVF